MISTETYQKVYCIKEHSFAEKDNWYTLEKVKPEDSIPTFAGRILYIVYEKPIGTPHSKRLYIYDHNVFTEFFIEEVKYKIDILLNE